ncbi:MAG: hypothetical protein PVG66_03495 [Chromatiales bacterium]|jgi:hypothetical protein
MIKKLLLIILFTQLSSCAVLHEEYFYPQANGATIEKEYCRGKVGADNQLVYHFDNVKIKVMLWEYQGITRLGITFDISEDATIVWPIQIVDIYTDNRKRELKADSFTRLRFVNRYESNDLLEKEYPVNSIMDRTTDETFETYSQSFLIIDKEISKLKIDTIKVIINGKDYFLSNIIFTKKSGVFLHPLNC